MNMQFSVLAYVEKEIKQIRCNYQQQSIMYTNGTLSTKTSHDHEKHRSKTSQTFITIIAFFCPNSYVLRALHRHKSSFQHGSRLSFEFRNMKKDSCSVYT